MRRHLLCGPLLGLALAAMLAGAASAETVFRIGREEDSKTFDPILTQENADIWPDGNIFASLARVDPTGTKIEPSLAESWSNSDDGMTWTFKLRENLKFGDGSPLKASDVRFSLLRARDTEESPWTGMYANIADVAAPDDRTVVITLKQPSALLLATMAWFDAAIIPEAYFNKVGPEQFAQHPLGAGPFTFKEWKRGDKLVFVKNPYYWEQGKPKVDRVEWVYVPDDATRILKLQAGEIDAAIFIPFSRIAELSKDPHIDMHLDTSSRVDHWILNFAKPPLDKLEVRRALAMGIDRQAIVKAVTFGYGKVSHSVIPCGGMYWNKDNFDYKHDPEGARKLLAQAGVSNPKIDIMIASGNSVGQQTAVLMKDQLAKIGVDLTISKVEAGQTWNQLTAGNYQTGLFYWTNDIIDPDEKITFAVSGDDSKSWYSGYKNPKVSALVLEGRRELNPEKRRQIYYDIQRIAKEDVAGIDLYCSPFRNASRKYVSGFRQDPLGRFWLEDVSVNK